MLDKKKAILKILSVEDSTFDEDIIREYLIQNANYEIKIDVASEKKEFLNYILSNKYDVILSDFSMPDFDGFAALQFVKKICPSTPFISLSGYIGEETAVELLKQGAIDYVSKDKLGRLIFSIERALKETKEQKEKELRTAELIQLNQELAAQYEKIKYLNYHDYLTGLYNRAFFEEEKKRLDTPRQLPFSILMGDINGLKLINDGLGHTKGDEILIEIASTLKKICREDDIVARIGGDEFGILLPKTDSLSAQLLCNRINEESKLQCLKGDSISTSISLGHATKTDKDEKIDNVLLRAEESMTKQKLLESKSAHSSLITSMKVIMFEKSHETEMHAERLGKMSKMIGKTLRLSNDQLNELDLFSTLHDIGKMSISADILSKTSKLSDEEWVEMRKHPEVGYRIAQASSELVPIANYILCHHERWDGKGYPQGLKGLEIPLLSRILSIVDAYDAMTNNRVYRPAMSIEEAIKEIEENIGTQFDPEIAQMFLTLIQETLDSK